MVMKDTTMSMDTSRKDLLVIAQPCTKMVSWRTVLMATQDISHALPATEETVVDMVVKAFIVTPTRHIRDE